MNKIVYDSYEQMSRAAAEIIIEQQTQKPDSVLGLATGSTPMGMYRALVDAHHAGRVDFFRAVTFNLDEYYRIPKNNTHSYHYYMEHNLFRHVNIRRKNTHIPDGDTDDVDAECARYDGLIQVHGGIDLQVLGIGANGHIGFNEPGQQLFTKTHLVKLTDKTIQDNAKFFDRIEDVPRYAITMGMGTIMQVKKIILLISGRNKAAIFKKIMRDEITTDIPASLLQIHGDVTVLLDKEAA